MPSSLHERVQDLMAKHPEVFPTEASVWSYIRGCLRRGFWEKSPMKFDFKNSQMEKPPENYTGRGRKGAKCALTGQWTMTSQLEVDHIEGHKSLLCEEDIVPYIIHLLASGSEELQLVDKTAHKIKSYAERMNITFEEAVVEKKVIEKSKLPVEKQKKILTSHSLPCHNAEARKESWRKYIKQEL